MKETEESQPAHSVRAQPLMVAKEVAAIFRAETFRVALWEQNPTCYVCLLFYRCFQTLTLTFSEKYGR